MPNLYALANNDLKTIVDRDGVQVTVTAPDGTSAVLQATANDIGLTLDVETQNTISGRTVSVGLYLADLRAAGLGQPYGVQDESLKPWRVDMFLPGAAASQRFKVVETMPDRLGLLICFLEEYQ